MKLNLKEKVAYGLGAVGKDMVYMLSASYVLYYFQDVLGVSAIAMGIILMVARIFDAFNDPIMGIVVAKTQTKWGKFRPWLFIGTLTNSMILVLMFSAPVTLKGNGLVAFAAVTYIMWGITYTMMDIPYWSMIPAFTSSGKERENLSALARSCAGVGSAIITIVTVLAVNALGTAATTHNFELSEILVTSSDKTIKAYVIELDEKDNPTGNVMEFSGDDVPVEVIIKANAYELKDHISYTQDNSKYVITFNDKYDETNLGMNFVMDSYDADTAELAIYVDEDIYSKMDGLQTISLSISSRKQVERDGFRYFSGIVAQIFVIFTIITCVVIKEKSTVNMKTAGIMDMFKSLVQNDQAMVVVITIVLVNIATYITSNLLIYFFKYDLAGSNWQGNYTLFNTFAGGVQIIAMMVFFPVLRKFFSTIKTFTIAVISSIVGYVVLLVMALSGVRSVYPFFVPGFLIMGAVGVMNVLVTIFLANTVDYGELKNNRRDESVIFSMQTFVVKLASGVAALVASVCLSIFKISESDSTIKPVDGSIVKGLDSVINQIRESGASVVDSSAVLGLRFTMTFLPIFGLVLALILFKKKYVLTDKKLEEIGQQVKAMHGESAESTSE